MTQYIILLSIWYDFVLSVQSIDVQYNTVTKSEIPKYRARGSTLKCPVSFLWRLSGSTREKWVAPFNMFLSHVFHALKRVLIFAGNQSPFFLWHLMRLRFWKESFVLPLSFYHRDCNGGIKTAPFKEIVRPPPKLFFTETVTVVPVKRGISRPSSSESKREDIIQIAVKRGIGPSSRSQS